MKWLVCGGRDLKNIELFEHAMDWLLREREKPTHIVHGGANGADAMASRWAKRLGIAVSIYLPDWSRHGRAAGPIRNQQMLDKERPDLVVAFPGGRGTADMVRRAKKANIEIEEIQ